MAPCFTSSFRKLSTSARHASGVTSYSVYDCAHTASISCGVSIGSPIQIDPALIEQFGRTMRENFTTGSVPFRKAYLQSLIDVIEVDDAQIRIKGSKDVLERAVLAGGAGPVGGSQMSTRWRAGRDSNPCPQIRSLVVHGYNGEQITNPIWGGSWGGSS